MVPSSVGGAISQQRIVAALDRLPPFSPVLSKVLASLSDEDVSVAELAACIEQDTVLAGNILRLVNSPLYGRRATINSVRHAVAIVGLLKIRNLVLGLMVSRRWANARVPRRWSVRQFNLHSLAVALLADQLAVRTKVEYAEGGFAAGLLHDLGKLVLAIAAPEEYDQLMLRCERETCPSEELEVELLGTGHSGVSGHVLERWNLPPSIRQAVTFHHRPDEAAGGELHLAHLVQAADDFVNEIGLGLTPRPAEPQEPGEDRFALRTQVEAVRDLFEKEFQELRGFL